MSKAKYTPYVELMLKTLPYVAKEKCFNLKGGTAINLFVRDLPRLSVDIDLTYTGREPRAEAIKNAEVSLSRIKTAIETHVPKAKVLRPTKSGADNIEKLFVVQGGIQIKIEANPVIRGTVFDGEDLGELPAVKWKIENIKKMDPAKRNEAIRMLSKILF